MKIVIDIPEDAYEAYKEWDKSGVATVEQTIIASGTPIQTVNNAEEAEAYHLPECKECRTCKHCMRGEKLPKITWENGYPFIFCARHHEHFSPNDTCEFWGKEKKND